MFIQQSQFQIHKRSNYLRKQYLSIMKSLIKFHFTTIFIHLILTGCIFLTKFQNIDVANVTSANYNAAVSYVNNYLIVSAVMLGLQMFMTMIGFSFTRSFFSIQIILQILGIFSYACFILMKMNYLNIAYMWGVFCFIPFMIDTASIITSMIKYRRFQAVKL